MSGPAFRRLMALATALFILAALSMWGYRTFFAKPAAPKTDVQVETKTVAGISFEVEFEAREGVKVLTPSGPDSIRFTRRGDVLDFDSTWISVNEVGLPDVKAGDVVRWNLDGPLLINGQPREPHPLQARAIDAQNLDALWEPLPSSYPRDTLGALWIGPSRLLVAAHGDGAVRVWDPDKRAIAKTLIPDVPKDSLGRYDFRIAVSPDAKVLAVASLHDEVTSLWDLGTGNRTATFKEPKGKVTAVGFAANDWLLEARGEKLFARRLVGPLAPAIELGKVHDQFAIPFATNSDATRIAWNDGSKVQVGSWKASNTPTLGIAVESKIEPVSATGCLTFSSDGLLLAVFDGVSRVAIHDSTTGQIQRRLRWRGKLEADAITAMAFEPDGKTLAVGGSDSIRFYDVPSGRERSWVASPWVRSLAYSTDGRTLTAGLRYLPGLQLWETADLVAK